MSQSWHDEVERAYAELESSQQAIAEVQRDMQGRTVTAKAKNRAVSVSCDLQGEVVNITFHTRAYRSMAGAELAALLMQTISEARRLATAEMATLFATVLPDATPVFEMLSGNADFDDMMREAMRHVGGQPGASAQRVG